MRAPEGSAQWRSYWKEGGSQAYVTALQAMEAADASAANQLAYSDARAAFSNTGEAPAAETAKAE
jgi:hypothetical protein